MMKPRTLKPIKSGFDDDQVAFYPRMASQAEREEVETALSEARAETVDKYQKIYEIKRQAIADWSAEMPKQVTIVKGETVLVPLVEDIKNTADAINKFFEKRTAENEDVISQVYDAYLFSMRATTTFL